MKTNIRVFFSLSLLLLGAHVVAQQTVAPVDTLTASSPIIDYAIPSGDLTIANIAIVGMAIAGGIAIWADSGKSGGISGGEGDCSTITGYWAGTIKGADKYSGPQCGNINGTFSANVNSSCIITFTEIIIGGSTRTDTGTVSSKNFNYTTTGTCTSCLGTVEPSSRSLVFSGTDVSGVMTGCNKTQNYTGTKQ